MKVKSASFDNYETHRFFCSCGSPRHVLDIVIDSDYPIEINYFSGNSACGRSLWSRLKMAFALIFNRTQTLSWSEFLMQDEDVEEVIKLLAERNKKLLTIKEK